jgi:hypothetical protein
MRRLGRDRHERHRPALAKLGAQVGRVAIRVAVVADVVHANAEATGALSAVDDLEQPRGLVLERPIGPADGAAGAAGFPVNQSATRWATLGRRKPVVLRTRGGSGASPARRSIRAAPGAASGTPCAVPGSGRYGRSRSGARSGSPSGSFLLRERG